MLVRCLLLWAVLQLLGPLANLSAQSADVIFEPTTQIPAQGGPSEKLAFLPGGSALLSGGVGMVSLGDDVGVGLGGYSLASEYVPLHNGVRYDMGYSYWGLELDRSFFTHHLFYLDTSILAGPAQGWAAPRMTGAGRVYVNFAQVEPEANLMLNVTHELRLGLGLSWRFCGGDDLSNQLGTNLNGGAVTFVMMYGQN